MSAARAFFRKDTGGFLRAFRRKPFQNGPGAGFLHPEEKVRGKGKRNVTFHDHRPASKLERKMAGIDLLEDSSLDLVSRAEEGDFFRTAGSFRKGEKERWEKDLDLVQRK